MKLKELQEEIKKVDSIVCKKIGDTNHHIVLIKCLKAQEELGEVADVIVRALAGSRKGAINLNNSDGKMMLGKELADTISLLIGIANFYDIDLTMMFKEKIKKDIKRYE